MGPLTPSGSSRVPTASVVQRLEDDVVSTGYGWNAGEGFKAGRPMAARGQVPSV